MRVTAAINIPHADSYGNPLVSSISMPQGSLARAIEWLQGYEKLVKEGSEFTIRFEPTLDVTETEKSS